MRLLSRLVWVIYVAALGGVLAGAADAARWCRNFCTCSTPCSAPCRDDDFVPTTCGAGGFPCGGGPCERAPGTDEPAPVQIDARCEAVTTPPPAAPPDASSAPEAAAGAPAAR